ncbi:Cro/CI family transcriptional regulator [Massilia rhizosphaerae]|uniref:Cro/CI family transcriptional regulator n=1 Tax=Massilia rhizosphaerae TaxID=2784389 RepID=UPI0018DD4090|nr:Cro/CI family transcriptional regulator [Massilia rhizosphaerae]
MDEQQDMSGIALAVKKAGTQEKLAKNLGVSQQAISQWIEQGWVPLRRAAQIEQCFSIPRTRLVDPRIVELVIAPTQAT